MSGRQDVETVRIPIPFAPSEKHWRSWLADARTAAGNGNWREAIHYAYWAGISNLEESGAWIPDRARTPREYLRLISPNNSRRPVLHDLTKKFELTWYGQLNAQPADYDAVLLDLEKLGCR